VDCKSKKGGNANLVESDTIIAVVSKVNLVGNTVEWIVDTSATKHTCANRGLFQSYEKIDKGVNIFIGNSASASVIGKGKITLKLTFGKLFTLTNVLHVPEMRRNLISGSLLMKAGLKLTFVSDRLVMTRNGEFVGKGFYCNSGLIVLDTISENMNKMASTSPAYTIEPLGLWHARLGHVNVDSIKRLNHLNLISKLSNMDFSKCEVCVEAKFHKKLFKSIE